MIINKTSWHFQLIKFFSWTPKDSLCPYVRQVIGAMALAVFTVIVACAMFWAFVINPLHVVLALMGVVSIAKDALAMGLAFWTVYVIAAVVFGGHWLRKRHRKNNPVDPTKQPNIFVAYVKAKKSKFCPQIDFQE